MKNLELESEAIRISKYCHVICQILSLHKNLSLVKLVFFSYILKTKKEFIKSIYRDTNKNFLDDKITSIINGDYDSYCQDIHVILKALHLLLFNKNCKLEEDIVFFIHNKGYEIKIYKENSFIYNAIEYSKNKIEDFQFLKEIVQNV